MTALFTLQNSAISNVPFIPQAHVCDVAGFVMQPSKSNDESNDPLSL